MTLSQGSCCTIWWASSPVLHPLRKQQQSCCAFSSCSMKSAGVGSSMRPLGSSKASEPAKECPEKSTSRGWQRSMAALTSSSAAAGSTARSLGGMERSRNFNSCPSWSGFRCSCSGAFGFEKSASIMRSPPRFFFSSETVLCSSTYWLTKLCRSKRLERLTDARRIRTPRSATRLASKTETPSVDLEWRAPVTLHQKRPSAALCSACTSSSPRAKATQSARWSERHCFHWLTMPSTKHTHWMSTVTSTCTKSSENASAVNCAAMRSHRHWSIVE